MADGNQTFVVTSNTMSEAKQKNHSVWEIVTTATFDADDTTDVSLSIPINGTLKKVILKVPNTTNAITTQIQIKDNGDNVVFDSGEQAENATYKFNLSEPLSGTIDIVVGVSGAVGANGSTIVATLRGV